MKLSIYEASKDKDLLNSTDSSLKDNNMIELERTLLVNVNKSFLLPNEFIDSIFYEKKILYKISWKIFLFIHFYIP